MPHTKVNLCQEGKIRLYVVCYCIVLYVVCALYVLYCDVLDCNEQKRIRVFICLSTYLSTFLRVGIRL